MHPRSRVPAWCQVQPRIRPFLLRLVGKGRGAAHSGVHAPPHPTTPHSRRPLLPGSNAAPYGLRASGPPCLYRPRSPLRRPAHPTQAPVPSPRPALKSHGALPARGGKQGARVTPDLAYLSPDQLRSHLTRGPRRGGSISRVPAPIRPTPTRPSIGRQNSNCTLLLAECSGFPVADWARGNPTQSPEAPPTRGQAGEGCTAGRTCILQSRCLHWSSPQSVDLEAPMPWGFPPPQAHFLP